jgi:hypothetical protein
MIMRDYTSLRPVRQEPAIEAPCSKLQGIFDPQGESFILIARIPRSKLRGMRSLLDSAKALTSLPNKKPKLRVTNVPRRTAK